MSEPKFTREQALKELNHFRELMGKKSFWNQDADLKQAALTGFIFMWLRTEDLRKEDQIYLESILIEFEKRNYLVNMNLLGNREDINASS